MSQWSNYHYGGVVVRRQRLSTASGMLERQSGVTYVVAGKIEDISHELDKLAVRSRDFH